MSARKARPRPPAPDLQISSEDSDSEGWMFFDEHDDAFTPLRRFLDRRSAVSWEDLRDLGYGRRMVRCALEYKLMRRVAPGLYVDARRHVDGRLAFLSARVPEGAVTLEAASWLLGLTSEWYGWLYVALPRGRHFPRTAPLGLLCAKHRGEWTEADVVTVPVPYTPGIAVRCFNPLRTFAELAAAGSLDSAGEVGRELLRTGERPETLLESLLRLGLKRRRVGDVMFELFAPEAHQTWPAPED